MTERSESSKRLAAENDELRRRVAALETALNEAERAEKDLRCREANWRSVVEQAPHFVAIVDDSGKTRYLNRFRPGFDREGVLGRPIYDFLEPLCHAAARSALQHVFRTGQRTCYRCAGAGPEGSEVQYGTDVGPLIVDGKIVAATLISGDFGGRKPAAEALPPGYAELEKEVRERTAEAAVFRRFIETSRQGVGMADLEGRITYANPALCRMFGEQKADDVIGKHLSAYYPSEYMVTREEEVLPALRRDGHWEGEVVLSCGGKKTVILHNSFLIRDGGGNPTHLASVITDITERNAAQEALRQLSERLSLATRAANVGVWDLDVAKDELLWDESMFRLYGITPSEFRGAYEAWRAGVHPEDLPRAEAEVHMALRGEKEFDTEFRVVWPDQSVHWIKASAVVQRDALGNPVRMLGTNWDVTKRTQTQEALERERQSLWKMLQAGDHERQIISYEIHDGLAQQLAAATMHFQAYEHLMGLAPGKARRSYDAGVAMVQKAHCESRRLISGVRPPALDEAGIATAIAHLVHEQRKRSAPQVEYHDDVGFDRLPPILENAIYRIAQEALANACEHSGSDRVCVSLVQEGDHLHLEVRDWGRGFDPQRVEENRFGLAGIRERTRLLGGQLSLESRPGKGTCVRVVLPVIRQE